MDGKALVFFGTCLFGLTACNSHEQDAPQNTAMDLSANEQGNELANETATAQPTSQAGPSAADPVDPNNSNQSALSIIKDAGHVCSSVVSVQHLSDSSMATCDDGEKYRLIRVTTDGKASNLAMKCSAMEARGMSCQ